MILRPTSEAPKSSWLVGDGASLVKDRSPIRSVAQALANARICAQDAMGSAWGRVLTSPTEPKPKKFGHPIVWRSDVAYSYEPNGLRSNDKGVPEVSPIIVSTDEMWSLVSKNFPIYAFLRGARTKTVCDDK